MIGILRHGRVWLSVLLGLFAGVPAFSQIDFSGEWTQIRHEDSQSSAELGDYFGVPLNEAGRARVENWDASIWSLPIWQCRPHSAPYMWRAPGELRISKVIDPISRQTIAFREERKRNFDRYTYVDGRPHPNQYAPHTWGGFSTGKWNGDIFTVTTTHIKEGYLKTNGIPQSDKATLTEHWIRKGDRLTIVLMLNDPVYLSEPYVTSTDYKLDPTGDVPLTPCVVVEESFFDRGFVPHFLPGANPYINEYVETYALPVESRKAGAAGMYPEYQKQLRNMKAGANNE